MPLNMDPENEYGSPPHRPSINVPESRPSSGTPSSKRFFLSDVELALA